MRQACEPAHDHSHREVCPLPVARGNVFWVRIAANRRRNASEALGWAVARLWITGRPVNLHEHAVVDLTPERIVNGREIWPTPVRRELVLVLNLTMPGFDRDIRRSRVPALRVSVHVWFQVNRR